MLIHDEASANEFAWSWRREAGPRRARLHIALAREAVIQAQGIEASRGLPRDPGLRAAEIALNGHLNDLEPDPE